MMEFCIEDKLPQKLAGLRVIFCDGAGQAALIRLSALMLAQRKGDVT